VCARALIDDQELAAVVELQTNTQISWSGAAFSCRAEQSPLREPFVHRVGTTAKGLSVQRMQSPAWAHAEPGLGPRRARPWPTHLQRTEARDSGALCVFEVSATRSSTGTRCTCCLVACYPLLPVACCVLHDARRVLHVSLFGCLPQSSSCAHRELRAIALLHSLPVVH
jgi:hypothetical protein